MQPQLCSRCKKNVAVVFITRMENGKNINEGLCLKCAKNLGLPQVNEMMQRMGITDDGPRQHLQRDDERFRRRRKP